MKGTRPLDNTEIRLVSACFDGIYETRNRSLFIIGVSTGGRISELLSLRVDDVWQNSKPVSDETLFLELALRGYDLTKIREAANTETAEIVNIAEHTPVTENNR